MNEKLYHMVPKEMKGDKIVSLNELKEIDDILYKQEMAKYEDREELLKENIPGLNCSRKDLIYLTAVHPSVLKDALEKCGRKTPFSGEYFEIDPHSFDLNDVVVDLGHPKGKFEKYDPKNIQNYKDIPQETLEYYKEEFAKGEHPFIHHKIPQILIKGKLDVSNTKKIKI